VVKRAWAFPCLQLEELDVALGLVLGRDPAAQVAVVPHTHRAGLEPLRQVGGHGVGLLLVDAALEAVLRAPPPQAQGVMGDGRARFVTAGVVGLDQVEGLTPGLSQQLAQLRRVLRLHVLVGVQVHHPVAGGVVQRDVAGVGERPVPGEVDHGRAERARDLGGAVAGAGVDHDHLVHGVLHRLQAAGQHLLLVLHDHHQ
jgi:hypothetical protein